MPPENILTGLSAQGVQIHLLEQPLDGRLPLFARDAVKLRENRQVFHRAQFQVGRHRLGDDTDGLADVVRFTHNVKMVYPRRAGGRRHEGRQHADERGFTRAVRTEQSENFAVLDGKIQRVHGGEIAEAFRQIFNLNVKHGLVEIQFAGIGFPSRSRFSPSGKPTYAVMPTASARSALSQRRRISNVLMSRLVRLTSRCVA